MPEVKKKTPAEGLQHSQKEGRKPAANAMAAASKLAATAKKKRRAANKQRIQLLGKTLLIEIFKLAETLGLSLEKKVRKMMLSPLTRKMEQ